MKNIALFENLGKPEAIKWAEYSAKKLILLDAKLCAESSLINKMDTEIAENIRPLEIEEFEKFADVLISFGGDGTMLHASRLMLHTNIPIMGVNVGKLGFLAEFSVTELDASLKRLLEGDYRIVDRTVLETELQGEKIYALNDFVIEKKLTSRMLTIEAYANDHYIGEYRSDGLIITTPTGSSAYSLSCGGPIIAPTTEVVCLTPISPHTLTLRPLVIPDSSEITITAYSPNGIASLVGDGQVERTIKNDESVTFRRSESRVKLIKPSGSSYFNVLRNKMLWGAHTIDKEMLKKELNND
ncbi:MAG: NAD(+)/NADH kinase [Candidatus Kapaibacterium sp.]